MQNLTNTAWVFTVVVIRGPLPSGALASEGLNFLPRGQSAQREEDASISFGLLWSLWRSGSASFGLCADELAGPMVVNRVGPRTSEGMGG